MTMKDEIDKNDDNRSHHSFFFLLRESNGYTWEELQRIETNRRNILKRVEQPFLRVIFSYNGTCLKVLFKDVLLWGTLAIFVIVRIFAHTDHLPGYVKDLDDTDIGIIGGFLSFFLVLFVNQNQSRFSNFYHKSMEATERLQDVASIVAVYLGKAEANRIVRYMNGAHAAAYVGLASNIYSMNVFFVTLNNQCKFLTPPEMARIKEIGMEDGADAFRELLIWVIQEVKKVQDLKLIDARMSGEIRGHVQKFRDCMSTIYHEKDQPTHFFYIHFLSLLTAFYLPLFAVSNAYGIDTGAEGEIHWATEILTFVIVFLQAVFVIGLRLLGQVMIDPYGEDEEDLSVIHYVEETWKASNRILAARFPEDLNPAEEHENIAKRGPIGNAFDAKQEEATESSPPSLV